MKRVIHIIGHGGVVKDFLAHFAIHARSTTFRVYCRHQDHDEVYPSVAYFHLDDYSPTDSDITLLCCSVHEKEILKNAQEKTRLSVAYANIEIVSSLMARGFFYKELVFVLTNPSEIIAQYLWHTTQNKKIFALGLSHDLRRYKNIFFTLGIEEEFVQFTLNGNHWDFPLPIIDESSMLYKRLEKIFGHNHDHMIHQLFDRLGAQIGREFFLEKPPTKSGAQALMDVVIGLENQAPMLVSGLHDQKQTFAAGLLNIDAPNPQFSLSPQGHVGHLVEKILAKQKAQILKLMGPKGY